MLIIRYIFQKYNFQTYSLVTLVAILAAILNFQKKGVYILFHM